MTRLVAARLLFECFEQMGNKINPEIEPVNYSNSMITLQGTEWASAEQCADYEQFGPNYADTIEGWHITPDNWHNGPSEWFVSFIIRHTSRLDGGYVMELTDDHYRPFEPLTHGEAATAMLRLYCSSGQYRDAQKARVAASESYYASIGAEQAELHTDLLASIVRKVLHKANDAPVYKPELSRIYTLHIAGQKLLDGRLDDYHCEKAKYHDIERDSASNGMLFEDWSSSQGWDFHDLNDFTQFTNLRELTIANQQVTDISGLAGLPLEYLDLRWNHFSDISVLHDMTRLTKLFLQFTPVESLQALSGLPNLTTIKIDQSNVRTLDGFENLPRLAFFRASRMPLLTDVSGLKYVNDQPISAYLVGERNFSIESLAGMSNLWELHISYLTNEEAKVLEDLPSLTRLGLDRMQEGALTSLDCKQLNWLGFGMSNLKSLTFLRDMPNLSTIFLDFSFVESLDGVQNLSGLTELNSESSIVMDASALNELPNLESVTLPRQAEGNCYPVCGVNWYEKGTLILRSDRRMEMSVNPVPYPGDEATAKPEYVDFDSIGAFDESIITPEILALEATSKLPEANLGGETPVWHGYNDESLSYSNVKVNAYETKGYKDYFYEEYFAKIRASGMDSVRILMDFRGFTDGHNMDKVNIHAVKVLDQVLAWAIQYDVHVEFAIYGIPKINASTGGIYSVYSQPDVLTDDSLRAIFSRYSCLLAMRYADIPNRYLSFELFPEADIGDPNSERTVYTREVARAMWEAEGGKPREQKRLIFARVCMPPTQYAEAVAADGICLILEHTFPSGVYLYKTDFAYTPLDPVMASSSMASASVYNPNGFPDSIQSMQWPLLYFPSHLYGTAAGHNTVSFTSEEGFPKGTVFNLYLYKDCVGPVSVTADGKKVFSDDGSKLCAYTRETPVGNAITLKKAAQTVTFQNPTLDGTRVTKILEISIEIPGREKLCFYPHLQGTYTNFSRTCMFEDPEIRIAADGSSESYVNGEVKRADAEEYYRLYLEPIVALAKAKGVFYQCPEFEAFPALDTLMSDDDLLAFYNNMYAMFQRYNISVFNFIPYNYEDMPTAYHAVIPANFEGTPFTFDLRGTSIAVQYTAPMEDAFQDEYVLEKLPVGSVGMGNKGKAKVYAKPDPDSEVVYQPQKQEAFWVTDADGDWYEIMLPDRTYGWIRSKDCAYGGIDDYWYSYLLKDFKQAK